MSFLNIRRTRGILLALGFASTTIGCASDSQFLDSNQQMAENTALERGRFELNCQSATAEILSREVVQPAFVAPRLGGFPRAEYTIGVSGCNKRHTFVVVCAGNGSGCFAAGPGPFVQDR